MQEYKKTPHHGTGLVSSKDCVSLTSSTGVSVSQGQDYRTHTHCVGAGNRSLVAGERLKSFGARFEVQDLLKR